MAVQIGLKDLYYALLTSDPSGGTPTWGTPTKIPGVITANINPNGSNATLFAENGPWEVSTALGEISLELNVADLPLSVQAVLLGHAYVGGVMKRNSEDVPPWLAIGFKALKSNGKYRYTWLLKGKFNLPEQQNETKKESVNFQTPTINGSFARLDANGDWQKQADEDEVDYVPSIGSGWFTSVGGTAPTTPTISGVVPADAATAVVKTTTVAWTFSEAVALSCVTKDNFIVSRDGASIDGTLTVNAGRTVVTFTPAAQLTGSKIHTAIVSGAVKSALGAPLAAAKVTTFTTAV